MGLTGSEFLSRIGTEIEAVEAVGGPPRFRGVEGRFAGDLASLRGDILALATREPTPSRVEYCVDATVEVASLLYAGGAPAPVWRHWSGLAGHGFTLLSRRRAACAFLVLGGEQATLAGFRDGPPGDGAPDALALWQIAVGPADVAELPDRDDMDQAWLELIDAIPVAGHDRIDSALTELAEFWIGESEDDWDLYSPRVAPVFEPEVCAAAALAIRHGYRPGKLDEDVRRFLEPGLMPGFPSPVEW